MIGLAYDDFDKYYGLLVGPVFGIVFAIFGVFGGFVSDNANRKVFSSCVCVLWSLTTLGTGLIDSFAMLYIFRFLLGVFEAAYNPSAYSLISDYFHPKYRTTANSVYNCAIYLGGGLASLASVIINIVGWRVTYDIIGIIGVVSGILGFILIKEPKRGQFDPKKKVDDRAKLLQEHENEPQAVADEEKKNPIIEILFKFWEALKELFLNETCRYLVVAGVFRYWAGYSIGFFMPKFFGGVY